jgi:hypothetical protein
MDVEGVTNAFRVERKSPNDADVIVNINGRTRDQILHIKYTIISLIEGIKPIDFKIGRPMIQSR